MYRAQKKREMARKADEELRRRREDNLFLIDILRKHVNQLRPLSDAWADTYNALQYQEYLYGLLHDPEECHAVMKQIK